MIELINANVPDELLNPILLPPVFERVVFSSLILNGIGAKL